jgi:hypothetical protein
MEDDMRWKKILTAFGLLALGWLVATSATAGEILEETVVRGSGSPETVTFNVTLENVGEVRLLNDNLEDDAVEPVALTTVLIDGAEFLKPFRV